MSTQPDRDAWPVESQTRYLYAIARRRLPTRLRGKVGASDLVQQALLRAHQRRRAYQGDTPCEYRGWLRRIALRVIADAVRRFRTSARDLSREGGAGRADAPAEPAADLTSPSQRAVAGELSCRLLECLSRLPADQQTAVTLRHLHGLPVAEVCARMGRTERAVAGLLQRGVRGLRGLLEAGGVPGEPGGGRVAG